MVPNETDPALQKGAHEGGSIFIGDQKVTVTLQSYARLCSPGVFSEELLEKILRGVSTQKYADTVLHAAGAFGVSPSTVSRNQDRKAAHPQLKTALEQTSYADARPMLRELEAGLRSKHESATDSLREAFEELLTLHRLQVPALLRKTLMATNPIERMISLVRHSARTIKRTRGSWTLQWWLGTVLLSCESRFKRVKGYAEIAQVIAPIEVVRTEPQLVQTKNAA